MNTPLRILLLLALHLVAAAAAAQIGGSNIYEFLNLSPSARVSALGGNLITVRDDDVNLALANPALLNSGVHQQLAFSHNFHLAGIQHGYAAYGHHAEALSTTFHGGVQYVQYGEFQRKNELGEDEGTFRAAEYALNVGAARQVYERMTVGANLRYISSQMESYTSSGIAADLAAIIEDTASNFTITLVARNIGTQLSTYEGGNREPMPFQLQIGISKRLRYLPFRFSVIYHHLDRWNILYDDPSREPSSIFLGEETAERSRAAIWTDNFFRHLIFNGEFLLGKRENFRLRFGYNHFMRQELSIDTYRSLAGFSFGFGVKVKQFRLDYGRSNYHLGGGLNHLGISTSLREFTKAN